jgi:hypothetical protein
MCQVDEIRNYAEGYQGRNGLNKYLQEMKRISRRDELQEALPALFLTVLFLDNLPPQRGRGQQLRGKGFGSEGNFPVTST